MKTKELIELIQYVAEELNWPISIEDAKQILKDFKNGSD